MSHSLKYLLVLSSILFIFGSQVLAADNCIQCESSDSNNDCIKNPTAIGTTCPQDTEKVCYTSLDTAGKVTRGCMPEADCKDKCESCKDGDKCNKNLICKTCSSEADEQCIQNIEQLPKWNSICSSSVQKCMNKINDKGHLERGCSSAACPSNTEKTCKECETPNCNVNLFPDDRKKCYKCDFKKETCLDVHKNNIKPQLCTVYKENAQCYTYGVDEKTMARDCATDDTVCSSANDKCALCDTSECNDRTFLYTAQCIQCNSKDKAECKESMKASDATACKTQVKFNQESCFTQIKEDVVYRGCMLDREEVLGDCKDDNDCKSCAMDGCNIAAPHETDTTVKPENPTENPIPDSEFSCIRCRSDEHKDCRYEADKRSGERCRNEIKDDSNKKCFYGEWNGILLRGCLIDLNEQMQATCTGASEQCTVCESKNCNTKSGSAIIQFSTALLAVILFAMWIR